jgi:hypothetical protein
LIKINAAHGVSDHFLLPDQGGLAMACFTLSADKIKAATGGEMLARKLSSMGVWRMADRGSFDKRFCPDRTPIGEAVQGRGATKPQPGEQVCSEGERRDEEVNPATRSAAIQKLIAERAYELVGKSGDATLRLQLDLARGRAGDYGLFDTFTCR